VPEFPLGTLSILVLGVSLLFIVGRMSMKKGVRSPNP
jgi:hypothetical protein